MTQILAKEYYQELRYFEEFLKKIGFKRIEGSIYGLLTLSPLPLSSEEIQTSLSLSQSAVSNAVKTLLFFKAIEVSEDRRRNCRIYWATDDCLNIVANVFRKREGDFIREYRQMAERVLATSLSHGETKESARVRRFQSIISTCELGEIIMKFIYSIEEMGLQKQFPKITKNLPMVFELLLKNTARAHESAGRIKEIVSSKVKDYMDKITGEIRAN